MVTRDTGVWSVLCAAALLLGCTVDSKDEGFGDLTASPASGPGPGGSSSAGSASSSGDSSDGGATTSPGDASDSGAADSGGTTSPGDSGSTDGGPAGAPQPDDGMYSHCVTLGDCVGLTTCVLATDTDGFCSAACTDAVSDCDPAPGGTAMPACVAYAAQPVCALDCSGGAQCPGGMSCQVVDANMVCV
jgi:hypothetical protein